MQPENAYSLISVTLLGIVIDVSEVQSANAPTPISVTLLGIVIDVSEVQAENAKLIKQLGKQIGGVSNSNGDMAEEYFFNALYHGQRKMFGEKFDDVVRDARAPFKGFEDQYDMLMINGCAICIVEVKYKADSEDLARKILRKAQTFRANFPQHSGKKIYLAVAVMSIHPLTEQACIDNGISIIKQTGDTITIYDQNLKIF